MTTIDAIPWNAEADKAWAEWDREYRKGKADPRPDLFLDHDVWSALLAAAGQPSDDDLASDLFWALHTTRQLGASLSIEDGKARIRRGQMTQEDYEEVRQEWLLPRMGQLRPLLEEPGKWYR